jgi:CcmD family protein
MTYSTRPATALHNDPGWGPGLVAAQAHILAAPTPAPAATEQSQRSTEFVPVQGDHDTTSAGSLLVAAYIVMWALLLAFIFLSWRRQLALESRVGDLERAIGDADKGDAGS